MYVVDIVIVAVKFLIVLVLFRTRTNQTFGHSSINIVKIIFK